MAFNGSCVIQVQTDGDNTNNGGIFDFSTTNKSTNLSATSATGTAPVVSSVSYSFVSADIGAWLYIAAGTNWRPGLYQITAVSGGSATINATAGQYYLCDTNGPYAQGTSNGCATTASPTGGTWSVDYTQSATARYTYTDLVQATTTTCTSAANPFGVNCIGNTISITGGTGTWTTQRVLITNVSGATATVDKTLGGSGGTGGTGRLGGAIASLGLAATLKVAGMDIYVKAGTYSITSATVNATAGPVRDGISSGATNVGNWIGYNTNRVWGNTDTKPLIQASGAISTFNLFETTGAFVRLWNLSFDGASKSAVSGIYFNASSCQAFRCHVANTTSYGIVVNNNCEIFYCSCTGATGSAAIYNAARATSCESYANSVPGFNAVVGGAVFVDCLSYGNTGATTDGFNDNSGGFGYTAINCTSYGNGRAGFAAVSGLPTTFINCVAEANTGAGFRTSSVSDNVALFNCAGYNNSTNYDATQIKSVVGFVAGSSSFFTNAAGNNFALNNTAGGGAGLRATGWLGTSPRGTTTGYANIGAFDPQASAGGTSGARLIGPSALVSV